MLKSKNWCKMTWLWAMTVASIPLASLSCNKEQSPVLEGPTQIASGTPSVATENQLVPRPSFDEQAFKLTILPKGPIKANEQAIFEILLVPRLPYHVNAEYPHRFTFGSSAEIAHTSDTIGRESARIRAERLEMDVTLTPKSVGKKVLEGTLSFSLCTEQRCLMEKRALRTEFEAS